MDRKEDIGKLVANKLKSFAPKQEAPSWDTLHAALDEKDQKKRRKNFFFWFIGGASILTIILMLLTPEASGNLTTNSINTTTNTHQINTPKNNRSQAISYVYRTLKLDTSIQNNTTAIESIENSSKLLEKELLKGTSEERKKLRSVKRQLKKNTFWIEESDAITTKYYYYNDSSKVSIEVDDPKVIDSILKNVPIMKDSISQ